MKGHYAKECRAGIIVVTTQSAYCPICGQRYKRTRYYGKDGWRADPNDNSLYSFIQANKHLYNKEVKENENLPKGSNQTS